MRKIVSANMTFVFVGLMVLLLLVVPKDTILKFTQFVFIIDVVHLVSFRSHSGCLNSGNLCRTVIRATI